MPSAFRLPFSQPRPSPRSEEPTQALTLSSSDFEHVSSNPESPGSEASLVAPSSQGSSHTVTYGIGKLEELRSAPICSVGLSREEKDFALEEKVQWEGELSRMDSFNAFLQSLTHVANSSEHDRGRKFQASASSQELQHNQRNDALQMLFVQFQKRCSELVANNQRQRECDRVLYEDMRDKLMKGGRERRVGIREISEKALEICARELNDDQQEDFDKDRLGMTDSVNKLVKLAEGELELLRKSGNGTAPPIDKTTQEHVSELLSEHLVESYPSSRTPSPRWDPGVIPICELPMPGIMPTVPMAPPTLVTFPPPSPRYRPSSLRRSRSPSPSRDHLYGDEPPFAREMDRREREWLVAEQTRDDAEEERQTEFTSALVVMDENFSDSMAAYSEQYSISDKARQNRESTRDIEFDASLGDVASSFKSFIGRIEKRFRLLDSVESGYDDVLKDDLKAAATKEEKVLDLSRKKRWRRFHQLQAERQEQLKRVFLELAKLNLNNVGEGVPVPPMGGPPPVITIPPGIMPGIVPIVTAPQVMPPGMIQGPMPMIMPMPYEIRPPIIIPADHYEASLRSVSRSRSPSPPTGFAPQQLFKMRNLSSLPIPRPGRDQASVSNLARRHTDPLPSKAQRAETLGEGLLRRRFAFAINETKRQIKFEQMQAERKRTFEIAESRRDVKFEQSQQLRVQRFLEGEQRRETEFLEKMKTRRERFEREQERLAKEYPDLEDKLVKECLRKEATRLQKLREWATSFVAGKRQQWEAACRREVQERKEKFGGMLQEFKNLGQSAI